MNNKLIAKKKRNQISYCALLNNVVWKFIFQQANLVFLIKWQFGEAQTPLALTHISD